MRKNNVTVLFAMLASAASSVWAAEAPPVQIPTNLPGVTTSIDAPQGFDAVAASDYELSLYGFPPRPDKNANPKAFATWARAMTAAKFKVNGPLQLTNIYHGVNRPAPRLSAAAATKDRIALTDTASVSNASYASSYNWSGVAEVSPATSYNQNTSFYYAYAQYVVPVARQAFGVCTGSWDYSSSWVGIDGLNSSDVLQTGTESDAYCSSAYGTSSFYSAWYEFFPYGSVRVPSLPVTPGDLMFAEVWDISSTQGYIFLENYNTNQYIEYLLTAPAGYPLTGNSAEFVVERPGVNGSLATLTNYISDYFSEAYASTWAGTGYTPGGSASTFITMLDNNGNNISYPVLLGNQAVQFYDTGSAY